MTSRSMIKRAGLAAAMSLATVMTCVSPASAATDINGAEWFDTNKMLMTLCTGSTRKTHWVINVETGKLVQYYPRFHPVLGYPVEKFEGHCSYPQSASWTWGGKETRVSDLLINCSGRSERRQDIQANGNTTSTTTNSVTGSLGIQWEVLKDVLKIDAGASYQRSWSYATTKGWSKTTTLTVPPRTVGWMAHRPTMRTVRSNPVFHIDKYTWHANGKDRTVNSYRGRGYRDINSYHAYYDASANVLNGDGTPAGAMVGDDRPVKRGEC